MTKKTSNNNIIVVIGPTASGKSDLALRLAKLAQGKLFKKYGINGAEIISADSRQVYRGMDIGTGKVKKDSVKHKVSSIKGREINSDYYSRGVRHYLIDVISPKKIFTASDFKRLGEKAIKEIVMKDKVPIIVGGTGFYVDILLGRIQISETPPNKKLRTLLNKLTAEKLFKKLKRLDPQRTETIDRHNKRRLIRALEITLSNEGSLGPTPSLLSPANHRILWLGINPEKEELAKRIKKRLNTRLKKGMIEEVINLHDQGLSWKRMDDLGLEYRWISRWLIQNIKIKNQANKLKTKNFKESEYYRRLLSEIIKYSKRQMTWFKRNKEIHWVNNEKEAERLIKQFRINT